MDLDVGGRRGRGRGWTQWMWTWMLDAVDVDVDGRHGRGRDSYGTGPPAVRRAPGFTGGDAAG